MSFVYTHLLIPEMKSVLPAPSAIALFFGEAIELGVVGDAPTISFTTLKDLEWPRRVGRNPVTGQEIVIPGRKSKWPDRTLNLSHSNDLPAAVGDATEYNADLSGFALPKVAPMPIDFAEPGHLRVGCRIRSQPASMWSEYDSSGSKSFYARFGQICPAEESAAYFRHPQTMKVIEVPGAGYARFWIEFELGKNLCPKIEGTNLAILNQQILALATRIFRMPFQQGCNWR